MTNNNKTLTVIIPVYNGEKYIESCLDSVYNQTYQDFEIFVVNDGSTDNTLNILKKYAKKKDNLEIFSIKNSGQGFARNYALRKSKAKYIYFLDADDLIEPYTFELCINKLDLENSDFVYFDWKSIDIDTGKSSYSNVDEFFYKKSLKGDECSKYLLNIQPYFTVNKLYRRSFLEKNNIEYGEGYIYEDVPFWVKVSVNAKNVSLIHSPLYTVRVNNQSTTKSNYNTSRHVEGFFKAMDESEKVLKNHKDSNIFYSYMIGRFLIYYTTRTPYILKKGFRNEFYERICKLKIKSLRMNSKFINLFVKKGFLNNQLKFNIFLFAYRLYKTNLKIIKFILKFLKSSINFIRKKNYRRNLISFVLHYFKKSNEILFMGFDYRYTGNSRYLFEQFEDRKDIFFATTSNLVPKSNVVKPHSWKFYKKLYTSKVVIFESWIPQDFIKKQNTCWINLWHGTPLKKMFFDSNEEEIFIKNPKNKINKYKTLINTDYLLTDNININKYFNTSFLFDDSKLLDFGYPRVKYLIDNKNNKKLKEEIRNKLNISSDKKIIMYLPTWRDYNYGTTNNDFDYFLDQKKFSKNIGKDYVLISKDHAFLRKAEGVSNTDIETQELLLVSDFVISDYSSVIFDAFAIDIPVCLLVKDFDKYQKSRGVYLDMYDDLKSFVVDDENSLINLIKNYKIDNKYKYVKKKYAYLSSGDLHKYINDKLN